MSVACPRVRVSRLIRPRQSYLLKAATERRVVQTQSRLLETVHHNILELIRYVIPTSSGPVTAGRPCARKGQIRARCPAYLPRHVPRAALGARRSASWLAGGGPKIAPTQPKLVVHVSLRGNRGCLRLIW